MQAYLHSKKIMGEPGTGKGEKNVMGEVDQLIPTHDGNNGYIAVIGDKKYSAVYNPFVGAYYVDDKYGEITEG